MEADRLNFDSVWVHDHISYGKNWIGHRSSGLIEQIMPASDPELFEAITTLAYVAGFTERIRIGTSVLVLPLRNPLVLGRELITLQALSAGRLVLGVAVGDYPDEFHALRVPYQERGKITDEHLEILQKIFRGGVLTHHGHYVSCDAAYFYPRVKAPPVFIGGGVIADPVEDRLVLPVLKRVARFADGWMPDWGSPELIHQGVTKIKELRRSYGRQDDGVQLAWTTKLYLADTDEEARDATARSLQGAEIVANAIARFGARSPQKAYEKSLIGSPKSIAAKIAPYADVGVDLVVMTCMAPSEVSFVDMLRRFDNEVAKIF
jgi:alkanesulfonate monooxygenase SsuD/methylene tetrahydromethanopterin reductase-like flavin-dependent oxidoreductase (luciferase family)